MVELSAAQTELWVAQQLAPDVPMAVAVYLDLSGPLDLRLLEESGLQATVELQSPHLRFALVDGRPQQCVEPLPSYRHSWCDDLSGRPDPVGDALAWMERDCRAPIDPLVDDLSSTRIFVVGPQRYMWYLRSHHIVLDGLGAATIMRRAAELYDAAMAGRPAPPSRAVLVGEILATEQQYRGSARFADDRAYWRERLADFDRSTSLVEGAAAPSAGTHRVTGMLDPTTVALLGQARRRHDATFVELTIAAFICYLARMTGDDAVTVSLPVAARPTAALRHSGGSVSNVVPLRITEIGSGSAGSSSVGSLVTHVRARIIGALRHQLYRYGDILRDAGGGVERGSLGPVINVLGYTEPITFGSVVSQAHLLSLGPVEDLLCNGYQFGPDDSAISIDFHANPALYSHDSVALHHRMFLEYFARFLATDVADPIPMVEVSAAIRVHPPAAESERTLPDLLRAAVSPADAVALCDGTRTLTYGELDDLSSQWARELIARGVGPGTFVAVVVARSIESVLALWAVAKSGGCFVPLDPSDPQARLVALIADSSAHYGITLRHDVDRLPSSVSWLVLDDVDTAADARRQPVGPVDDSERCRPLRIEQVAYLIYTSGSTGTPKGVAVTHRGLSPLTDYIIDRYKVTCDSIVLHAHSPSFDAHLLELLATFGVGARLVIEPVTVVAGVQLQRLLLAHKVTHFLTTPAVLATLSPDEVPSLTTVVVGGEQCPADLVRQWAPHTALFNSYGPTETTVMACQTEPMAPNEPVTIGYPLPTVQAFGLNTTLRQAPVAARAELYIGGSGVAEGYHGNPTATALRFVANPFDAAGGRMYRTGDLVRVGPDGVLEFLGRADAQVSLRGRRIELAEIEAALVAMPEIDRAVVTVAHSATLGDRLVGYVVAADGVQPDTAAVLARLHTTLPPSLIPASLVELAALPVTPNGKIDRRALAQPVVVPRAYRPPETAEQQLVAELMAEVVDQPRVGLDDDFFDLGGNSLLGVALAGQLATATGVPVTVRWLYTTPTVAALAARIASPGDEGEDDALGVLLPLRRGGTASQLFCIHSAVPLAWCYAGLARYLPDRPVYGLQVPSSATTHVQVGIDDLAEIYVEEITRVQPTGPYHLLGWSLGGQIAHAIAVRLRRAGAEVGVLTMLDSVVIPEGAPPPPTPRMRDLLTHLLGDEPEDADQAEDVTAEQAAQWLHAAGPNLGAGLTAAQLEHLHRGYVDGVRMSHGYYPERYDGDLLYFSATRGVTADVGVDIWRPFVTGRLTEHPVVATHAQLTNSDVCAVIGPILAAHLASVDRSRG